MDRTGYTRAEWKQLRDLAVGCVALTPVATAADRALAEVPAARAFVARE